MKLSAKNASSDVTEKLEQELKEVKTLVVDAYVLEKGLCIQHLLDGYPAQTLHGYDVSNKVVKDLAKKFPELVTEE